MRDPGGGQPCGIPVRGGPTTERADRLRRVSPRGTPRADRWPRGAQTYALRGRRAWPHAAGAQLGWVDSANTDPALSRPSHRQKPAALLLTPGTAPPLRQGGSEVGADRAPLALQSKTTGVGGRETSPGQRCRSSRVPATSSLATKAPLPDGKPAVELRCVARDDDRASGPTLAAMSGRELRKCRRPRVANGRSAGRRLSRTIAWTPSWPTGTLRPELGVARWISTERRCVMLDGLQPRSRPEAIWTRPVP